MVAPAQAMVTARPDIAQGLEEFDLEANQKGFVGKKIMPVIDVDKAFGQYSKLTIQQLLRKNVDTSRANDGTYGSDQTKGSTDSYACIDHGFEERVDEREAEMYGEWWDAELIAASMARQTVLQDYETRVVAAVNAVSNTTAANTAWSSTASATPITNIKAARKAIRNRTGAIANTLCLEWEAFEELKDNAQIIDRMKHQGFHDVVRENINEAMIAAALDLEQVVVAGGLENTKNEGQTPVLGALWPRTKALLLVTSTSKNLKAPRWGNTFHWAQDGSTFGESIESYEDPRRRSQMMRARADVDEKVVYADCAQLITGVLT